MNPVAIAAMAALAVAMGVGRFAFTPILPMMQDDAGLTLAAGGWLAAANYAGYLAGALSAIRLRLPPGTAIRVGLAGISATTLAMGLAGGFAYWLVLRALAGIASAWVLVFVSAWALRRIARGGTVYAGVGAGIAVAGIGCLALMAAHASSSDAWLALGAASCAVTAALWRVFQDDTTTAAVPQRSALHWPLIFSYGAFGFGYIVPATFLPAMARAIVPDPALFGWAWPLFGLAAAISTLCAGRFTDQRRVWIVASLVMALGVLLPLFAFGLAGVVAAAVLVGGTFMVITMAGLQEARRIAADQARPLMAAMTAAFAAGQAAGPLMVSLHVGLAPALAASAGALLFGAFFLLHNGEVNASSVA